MVRTAMVEPFAIVGDNIFAVEVERDVVGHEMAVTILHIETGKVAMMLCHDEINQMHEVLGLIIAGEVDWGDDRRA